MSTHTVAGVRPIVQAYTRQMATETPATLGRAWKLVAYFFGEGDAAPAGVAPDLIDKICSLHRLDVALVEPRLAVRSPADFLTPEIWGTWKRRHRGAIAQAVGRAEPLRKVFDALFPLEAIVFKGAALAELFYANPGARPMTDVDLLVRPEEAPEAARRLLALGYHCCFELPAIGWLRHSRSARLQEFGYRRRLWGQPFFHRPYYSAWTFAGPEMEIDLHRGLTQQALMSADYSAVFQRSFPWYSSRRTLDCSPPKTLWSPRRSSLPATSCRRAAVPQSACST